MDLTQVGTIAAAVAATVVATVSGVVTVLRSPAAITPALPAPRDTFVPPPSSASLPDARVESLQASLAELRASHVALDAKVDGVVDAAGRQNLDVLTKLTAIETTLKVKAEERLARREERRDERQREDRRARDTDDT